MDYLDKFKQYIGEVKNLEEENATANLDGGEGPVKTPKAFNGKDIDKAEEGSYKEDKKKQKDNATTATEFEMVNDSLYKKMMSMIHETGQLNETSYRDFKKDPTSTPQQKVNRGIMEVNKMLGSMEKIVNNNLRLKTEMGVQSDHFWKATGNRFAKINERMVRIANRLKELSA